MKKVVNESIDVVSINKVSKKYYYGVHDDSVLCSSKGFINNMDNGFYITVFPDPIPYGHYIDNNSLPNTDDLNLYIKSLLDNDMDVYQFNSFKKLMNWINNE